MSPEYLALSALFCPNEKQRTGDMWLCRRLGIVRVMTGHKRGTRRGERLTNFHLYHWGKLSIWSRPCDFRDNDPNASVHDPKGRGEEKWEYLGNIGDMLPYRELAGAPYKSTWSGE